MEVSRVQFEVRRQRCVSGKHKFRENKFGVTWCVNCGLIGKNAIFELVEDDKLVVVM